MHARIAIGALLAQVDLKLLLGALQFPVSVSSLDRGDGVKLEAGPFSDKEIAEEQSAEVGKLISGLAARNW